MRVLDVAVPADTALLLLDTALLRDADDADAGFYALAKGSPQGSVLYASHDDVAYTPSATFTAQGVFGSCTTTLNNWSGGRVFDEISRLSVNVGTGVLASTTRAAMLAHQTVNLCAIGVNGRWELCQFRDATLTGAGIYTLGGFLRGSRGTEWASTGHVAGEAFVLISRAMQRIAIDAGDIGQPEFYKGVTVGRALSTASAQAFTDNAVGKKPFAPVRLRCLGGASAAVVTWDRRTRLSTRFASSLGFACPLGEEAERYVVELRGSGGALLSSATVAAPTWTGDVSAAASITVLQLSAIVGRGYPATLTL